MAHFNVPYKTTQLMPVSTSRVPDPLGLFWEREAESIDGVGVATPEWTDDRGVALLLAGQAGHGTVLLSPLRPAH